jgi:hypothetical protein
MQVGDLAPTFANLYPEILDDLIEEAEFRDIIKKINDELIAAFSPYSARAWIDALLGLATFWLWDDLGLASVKKRLDNVEKRIEKWNSDVGIHEGVSIISLRRTAYLSVSFTSIFSLLAHANSSYSSIFKFQIRTLVLNLAQVCQDLPPDKPLPLAAMREDPNKDHIPCILVLCNTSIKLFPAELLYEQMLPSNLS